MHRRRRKGLTEEDVELWSQVVRTAKPLHPQNSQENRTQPPKSAKPANIIPKPRIRPPSGKPVTPEVVPPDGGGKIGPAAPAMDRKRFEQLRRGRMKPEARIDLHGMTAARALPSLTDFVLTAHSRGLRLLLVITGKGSLRHDDDSIIPRRRGLLRHSVPQWLSRPPLGPLILQIQPAHARHGGAGAYYVYLRRPRPREM